MYKNPGRALKRLANVLCILCMVLCVLGGIGLILSYAQLGISITGLPAQAEGAIAGILVIALGCFFSWLSFLFLAAFGDLAMNTKAIRDMMKKQSAAPAAPVPSAVPVSVPAEKHVVYPAVTVDPAPAAAEPEQTAQPEETIIPEQQNASVQESSTTHRCPVCGAEVPNGTRFCRECGTPQA